MFWFCLKDGNKGVIMEVCIFGIEIRIWVLILK